MVLCANWLLARNCRLLYRKALSSSVVGPMGSYIAISRANREITSLPGSVRIWICDSLGMMLWGGLVSMLTEKYFAFLGRCL